MTDLKISETNGNIKSKTKTTSTKVVSIQKVNTVPINLSSVPKVFQTVRKNTENKHNNDDVSGLDTPDKCAHPQVLSEWILLWSK